MQTGNKFDQGKLRYDLVPPIVLEQLAAVLTRGAEKYGENNWQDVPNGRARYYAAMMRHVEADRGGEIYDEETGLPHLTHALACVAFLLYKTVTPVAEPKPELAKPELAKPELAKPELAKPELAKPVSGPMRAEAWLKSKGFTGVQSVWALGILKDFKPGRVIDMDYYVRSSVFYEVLEKFLDLGVINYDSESSEFTWTADSLYEVLNHA